MARGVKSDLASCLRNGRQRRCVHGTRRQVIQVDWMARRNAWKARASCVLIDYSAFLWTTMHLSWMRSSSRW